MAVHRKKDGETHATGPGNEGPVEPTTEYAKLTETGEETGSKPPMVVPEESSTDDDDAASGGGGGSDSGKGPFSGMPKIGPGGSSTGGKAKGKDKGKEPQGIQQWLQFAREVLIEFRKVTWPERPKVIRETWSVLFLVAAITLMVLGFDWVLSHLFFTPIEGWARMHGGGIGTGYH